MEKHFQHTTLARLLDVEPPTVSAWIKAGLFGSGCLVRGRVFLVPESGVEHFRREHRVQVVPALVEELEA